MSRKKIFLCVMAASVFINVVIFVIMILCGFTPGFTIDSLQAAPLVIAYYIKGISLYFELHPESSIFLRISDMKVSKKGLEIPHTVTVSSTETVRKPDSYYEERMRECMRSNTIVFCIFWFEAPFLINMLLFARYEWKALPFILPVVFGLLIWGVYDFRRDVKEINEANSRVAKELEEQKKREEMGHIK